MRLYRFIAGHHAARLALLWVALCVALIGSIYFALVPSLQHRLVSQRVALLRKESRTVVAGLPSGSFALADYLQQEAHDLGARVIVFGILGNASPVVEPQADSESISSVDVEADPIAARAAVTGKPAQGDIHRASLHYAEYATPIARGSEVLLLSSSLAGADSAAGFVVDRLWIVAAIAGVLSTIVSVLVAGNASRRLERIEHHAVLLSEGDFSEPVPASGPDEIGRVAVALEVMRSRLNGLDRSRREFIANASHELRTPIFALSGFVELLTNEEMDAQTQREFLLAIEEQIRRLQKLAEDLLDLSRLDTGAVTVESEVINLKATADDAKTTFMVAARSSLHSLAIAQGAQDVFAVGDETRTRQIVACLVDNAIKHTPGGSRIELSVGGDEGTAWIQVRDSGPLGIPAEQLEAIFQRFFRGDDTLAKGSGLGLAIARELTRLQSGNLTVASRPGETAFRLTLPSSSASEQQASAETLRPSTATTF